LPALTGRYQLGVGRPVLGVPLHCTSASAARAPMSTHAAPIINSATASAAAIANGLPDPLVHRSNQASAQTSATVAVAAGVTRRSPRQPSRPVSMRPTVIAMSSPVQAMFQCRATAVCGSSVAIVTVHGTRTTAATPQSASANRTGVGMTPPLPRDAVTRTDKTTASTAAPRYRRTSAYVPMEEVCRRAARVSVRPLSVLRGVPGTPHTRS
jgi:hypothetical protein